MSAQAIRSTADFADFCGSLQPGLAFAGLDPHFGIGLDTLVEGYRVVCLDSPPVVSEWRRRGVEVFSLLEVCGEAPRRRSTAALLSHVETERFLQESPRTSLLVFKSSHQIETLCRQRGWNLLAAPALVARRWENKVAFADLARRLGLSVPPSEVIELESATYSPLQRRLGSTLVLQAPHGYGGRRTSVVDGPQSLAAAVRRIRSPLGRVAAFVPGRPVTLNACVTARGTAVGPLMMQLTGEPQLTPFALGSCGNDFSAVSDLIPESAVAASARMARQIGESLATDGYRGVFGVDFVVPAEGQPVVIEVNPRLVASVALQTQLELAAGRLPLLARHVLAFLAPELDRAPLEESSRPVSGGQVIAYHLRSCPGKTLAGLESGVCRIGSATALVGPTRRGLRVEEASGPSDALVLVPAAGRPLRQGSEWLRLQSRQRVVGEDGSLPDRVARAVEALRPEVVGPRAH